MPTKSTDSLVISAHPAVATVQHLQWLDGIVKTVIVLNLLDILFTLAWVGFGHVEEANLLLIDLVRDHPILFVLAKISLVSLGSFLLWKHRSHPLAVVGIFLVFGLYYYVLLYHLRFTSVVVSYLIGL
ncbi:MAG: DUF5658 family protein [Gammaproteobacteria bacterium]|nr:hypothetical protein [Pseudomonadota bacterium]MCZ6733503.1 DUF5658 family protein [Gammaproteobacteria bacterium]